MTRRARCIAFVLSATSFGCASGAATGSSLDAKFAGQDAQRARELAPDLYAKAERARAEARGASDDGSRQDHVERAGLLFDAALAEADRIQFDRERAHIDEEIERAVAERAEHERARLAAEADAAQAEAAKLARAEAERTCDPTTRDARGRAHKAERERADAACTVFLFGRAELMLAAATALGLPEAAREEALRALANARDAKGPASERVRRARVALETAERALGAARAGTNGHDPPD